MAKKSKDQRVQVILECTEHKNSGQPGTSRYVTTKNKKEHIWAFRAQEVQPDIEKKYTVHKEIK